MKTTTMTGKAAAKRNLGVLEAARSMTLESLKKATSQSETDRLSAELAAIEEAMRGF